MYYTRTLIPLVTLNRVNSLLPFRYMATGAKTIRASSLQHVLLRALSSRSRRPNHPSLAMAAEYPSVESRYEEAVAMLNNLEVRPTTSIKERFALFYTSLERAGISLTDLDELSIIHIAGTKGKGSTCAFSESLLRHHGFTTGFLSSPHLVEVRERIRINGLPLSRKTFTKYFWEVYNKLDQSKPEANDDKMPTYAHFLTLLSFHVFLQEKPDVVILEVGLGGQVDATNVIRHPALCAVTSLGLDHMTVLGDTIDKIVWHKAGIFKPGTPALTVSQPQEAMKVLLERAQEKKVDLYVCPAFDQYYTALASDGSRPPIILGLSGEIQKVNATLALQLCRLWLQVKSGSSTPSVEAYELAEPELNGLANTHWCGRNQVIRRKGVTYFLDGAHTVDSIAQCIEWFTQQSEQEAQGVTTKRVLLFTLTGARDPEVLLRDLKSLEFSRVAFTPTKVFCSNIAADQCVRKVTSSDIEERMSDLLAAWKKPDMLDGASNDASPSSGDASSGDVKSGVGIARDFSCIAASMHWLTQGQDVATRLSCASSSLSVDVTSGNEVTHVLVTGSLYLVGGVLHVLKVNVAL